MKQRLTYKKAGVDISRADRFLERIKPLIQTTRRSELVGGIGGFSGLFRPRLKRLSDPLLVAATDGVGTKLMVATAVKKYDTVGIDLVAMCANDIVTCGAEPLFFLDYFATESLEPRQAVSVVKGIVEGCRQAGCALLGGETAEMPGLYPKGEFDLAGFCVGLVDKKKIIDGTSIQAGDAVLGIQSGGLHSNGFSLVRKVFTTQQIARAPLRRELLKPTILYVKPLLAMAKTLPVKGVAHITGGGFYGNIPRILPRGTAASIKRNSWRIPSIFTLIQNEGAIAEREMYTTFNMGIGMVVVIRNRDIGKAQAVLSRYQLKSWVIGEVVKGTRDVSIT
jgi:phosphoribosylformylglycinamidine cyclo-ligase